MNLDKLFNPTKYKDTKKVRKKRKSALFSFLKTLLKGVRKKMEHMKIFTQGEDSVILAYLDKQIGRVDETISELRCQIEKSPDDEYSKKKIQNQFYLRDELVSMKRRISIKE